MQNNKTNIDVDTALSNLWQVVKNVSEELKLSKKEKQQFKEKTADLE